ncbi:MAG: TetR/AcrR family transcriptional regulator [Bacteroidia bacterium]
MRIKDPEKIPLLFATALQLINEHGLSGLKLSELAQRSGMATGTLYLYFRDKDALLASMQQYYQQALHKYMADGVHEQAPFERQLRQKWYHYLLFLQRHPLERYFLEQFAKAGGRKPAATHYTADGLDSLRALLIHGQQQGILKKMPVELMLVQLCGAIYEFLDAVDDGRLNAMTELAHHAWQMAWDAIRR